MFGIDAIAGVAGSLFGGGAKGAASAPIRSSQDGSALTSGSGEFNVGGGLPKWLWPVVLGVVALGGLFVWKPWKQ